MPAQDVASPEEVASPEDEAPIRKRAHEIWEAEGRPEGRDEEHWHRARAEVAAGSASSGKPNDPPMGAPMAAKAKPTPGRA